MNPRMLTLAFFALLLGTAAFAQQITGRSSAIVKGASYTLGEVVDISGFDARQTEQLAALSVGTSPRVGYPERVTRAALERRVQAAIPGIQVRWAGPDVVALHRAASTVGGEDIVDHAAKYLYQVLAGEHHRVALQPVEALPDVPVNQGQVALRVRSLPYTEALRKRARIWVDVFVDGVFNRSVPVVFAVEVWRETWVSGKAIPAGERIDCSLLERREVDIVAWTTGATLTAVDSSADPCAQPGARARRALAAGQPLLRDAWAPQGDHLPGERVALRATGVGVVVEVPARMVSDDPQRKRVRVRLADHVLDAEIRGHGVVELIDGV